MGRYKVTVPLLNQRKFPVENTKDKNNIVGTVDDTFVFEGEFALKNKLGDWYKGNDNNYYWGGGITKAPPQPLISLSDNRKKDWGFIDFKIDELWKLSKGENIQVAILDSGLNYNLEDFKSKTNITYYNASTGSEKKEDCLDDSEGHGTDCAGILCGQGDTLWGVAPNITLNIIRITNAAGARTMPAILKGLDKAVQLNSNIISISFSTAKNDFNVADINAMHKKIQSVYDKNITIVASAKDGNLSFPVDEFPASFPECLSAGAVDINRKNASNRSSFLDLMGPGKSVFSLTSPNNRINGTSFSTPFIAGVIALLKSIAKNNNRHLTNIQLFDILKRSSDTNIDGYNKLEYGWGIINPVLALSLLQNS